MLQAPVKMSTTVHVMEVRELATTTSAGLCDPFVRVSVAGRFQRQTYIKVVFIFFSLLFFSWVNFATAASAPATVLRSLGCEFEIAGNVAVICANSFIGLPKKCTVTNKKPNSPKTLCET